MICDDSTLLDDLLQESEHAVLGTLARLKDISSRNGEDRGLFAVRFATALDDSTLGERERHLRLQRVVTMLRLDRPGFEQLATSARQLGPAMQSAVVGMLPADLRPTAYGADGRPDISSTISRPPQTTDQGSVSNSQILTPALREEEENESIRNVTILLLSAIEQEANRRLLDGAGFQVVNVKSVHDLDQWLTGSADICAFVVDRSFLSVLSVSEQNDLIRNLASYSSFAWIRLDGSGAELQLIDREVFSIAEDCRCRIHPLCSHELLVATQSNLHERELDHIRRAARLLSHPADGLVHLRNLDARSLQVLVAAAANYAGERFQDRSGRVAEIDVTLLHGGRSSDQVFVVRINNRGKPVLAKVGSMNSVSEEAKRFRHFLQDTSDYTPQLNFHRGVALLIYPLYSDDFEDFEPAPTFQVCLRNLWLSESGFQLEGLLLTELEFQEVISHATRRLLSLNRTVPPDSTYLTMFPAILKPILKLEEANVAWGFDPSVLDARSRALEVTRRLDSAAMVHGDIQFRNILVTSRADCALIDFPGVGPGQPGSDLARMELHFFSASLKQTVDHIEMIRFQTALSLDRLTLAQLLAGFPTLAGCQLNRVCIYGCVDARDAGIAAVEKFGGSHRDYLATKLLTAWQALTMDEMNHGATRAVISAISPAFTE